MAHRLLFGWPATNGAVIIRSLRKWRDRFRVKGQSGFRNPLSWQHCNPTWWDLAREAEIEAMQRLRLFGPAIARRLARPLCAVGPILPHHGVGRLDRLDSAREPPRYERGQPGQLIHLDAKKRDSVHGFSDDFIGTCT